MAWKVSLLALLSYATCVVSGKSIYEGAKVLNVFHTDHHLLQKLTKKSGLDVWFQNSTNTEFMVPSRKLDSLINYLDKKHIHYSIAVEDVQKRIDEERLSNARARSGRQGFSLDIYHRLDEIYNWMETLRSKYPKLVSIEMVGHSYEKRPIKCVKVSSGVPGAKAVFIDGGIHAREWISTATVLYILNELVENRAKLPAYMLNLDFYLLPVFNPDGYEYTHTGKRLWRKSRSKNPGSCLGTDLNRNFNSHFGGRGTSGSSCEETYRGPRAFSEPETKAFSEYILKIRKQLVGYIAFHSYGQYILLPYAYEYDAYPADYKELESIGKKAALAMRNSGGETYVVGTPGDILYPAAGGAFDWVKDVAGVKYCFTFELRDKENYGFMLPSRYIKPTAQEAFVGVKVMVEAASRKK